MTYTLVIFVLVVGVVTSVQFKKQRDLEKRAVAAARILHGVYALTPSQSVRIVYMNSWTGNVCMEYVVDDAREQSFIKYAVFEKGSKFVNYDLDQEERCNMAGVDLTNVAEKELMDRGAFTSY